MSEVNKEVAGVSFGVLKYYTSYRTSIGCEPSRFFHGRIPYIILDIKLGIRPQQAHIPTSQIAQDVLDQTETFYQDVPTNAMQAYIKYKAYYYKKANASKLKEADFVYVLQPKADHQGSTFSFTEFYQTTIIWCAKLALTRRKCSIACDCVTSHPDNHYLMFKSRHMNGNLVRK